jgi:hypothetical protein
MMYKLQERQRLIKMRSMYLGAVKRETDETHGFATLVVGQEVLGQLQLNHAIRIAANKKTSQQEHKH